jgi:hypothetical protein
MASNPPVLLFADPPKSPPICAWENALGRNLLHCSLPFSSPFFFSRRPFPFRAVFVRRRPPPYNKWIDGALQANLNFGSSEVCFAFYFYFPFSKRMEMGREGAIFMLPITE